MAKKTITESGIETGCNLKQTSTRTKAMSDQKSFNEKIDGTQLSSKEYRWVSIGKPFIPEENCYVWFAAAAGSQTGGVFVDKIELLPVENTKE